jgi:hypothetical protein
MTLVARGASTVPKWSARQRRAPMQKRIGSRIIEPASFQQCA